MFGCEYVYLMMYRVFVVLQLLTAILFNMYYCLLCVTVFGVLVCHMIVTRHKMLCYQHDEIH